jgi:hypothetical protein
VKSRAQAFRKHRPAEGQSWRICGLDSRQAGLTEIRGHHLYVVLFREGRPTKPSHVRYGLSHGVPAFRTSYGLRVAGCESASSGLRVSQPMASTFKSGVRRGPGAPACAASASGHRRCVPCLPNSTLCEVIDCVSGRSYHRNADIPEVNSWRHLRPSSTGW